MIWYKEHDGDICIISYTYKSTFIECYITCLMYLDFSVVSWKELDTPALPAPSGHLDAKAVAAVEQATLKCEWKEWKLLGAKSECAGRVRRLYLPSVCLSRWASAMTFLAVRRSLWSQEAQKRMEARGVPAITPAAVPPRVPSLQLATEAWTPHIYETIYHYGYFYIEDHHLSSFKFI